MVPWNRTTEQLSVMLALYERAEREAKIAGSALGNVPLRSPFLEIRKHGHAALVVAQNISQLPTFLEAKSAAFLESRASSLGIARYLIWAIPTIGFIGTVVGIGDAMVLTSDLQDRNMISRAISQAGISASIGLAFDTTLVALLLSLVAMLIFYLIQQQEELRILLLKDETLVDLTTPANAAPAPDVSTLVAELRSFEQASGALERHTHLLAAYVDAVKKLNSPKRRAISPLVPLLLTAVVAALAYFLLIRGLG
jgi:biopolymer transport protein ExbB/TolQ